MKLKTLKDITLSEPELDDPYCCTGYTKKGEEEVIGTHENGKKYNSMIITPDIAVDADELKQLAIKYVKQLDKEIKNHSHTDKIPDDTFYLDCVQCRNKYIQRQWIIMFFNIIEEELK